MKMLDLSELSIIDSHCHGFLPKEGLDSFEQYLNLASHYIPKEDMFNTFIFRQTVKELSRVLEHKGNFEEIISFRNKIYRDEPIEYTKLLFEDAKIKTTLIDTGYPFHEFTGYSIDVSKFSSIVPCEVKEIFRIDNLIYMFVKEQSNFSEAIEKFKTQIEEAVKAGAISLKTAVAYTSGLEVQRSSENEVKKSYKALIEDIRSQRTLRQVFYEKSQHVKRVMDFFVLLGVEESVKHNIPIQIHAGMGNPSIIDLRNENPILTKELVNDEVSKNAKIILIHGGYPYIEEAGFFASAYSNLFLDFSAVSPFISIGLKEKLLNLFEMTPTTKIMYGSDGHKIPELFWISAIQTKKALSRALNQLIENDEIDGEWALQIAKQILYINAKKIYNL
jgi:hypothetical protein